jgi:hypothetical protein
MKGSFFLTGGFAFTVLLLVAGLIGLRPATPTVAGPPAGLAATVTLYPVADAWVNYWLPDNNYGTANQLEVGSEECPGQEFPDRGRALIRFDLSAIPAGQVIQSASLQLYLRYAYSGSGSAATNRIGLYRVADSWTETGVTWNNQPGHTAAAYATTDVGLTTGTWYSWDATQLVREWYQGTHSNYGLKLVSQAETTCNMRYFDSRENVYDARLVITYGTPTPTYTPTRTPTRTPTPTPTRTPTPTPGATPTPVTSNISVCAVADAFLGASAPTFSYGAFDSFGVGYGGVDSATGVSVVRFDLSFIPAGSTIESAVFEAYQYFGQGLNPVAVTLHPVTSAWNEATVTWSTMPTFDGPATTANLNLAEGYKGWTVTGLVQQWVNGTRPNHGLMLRGPLTGDPNTNYYVRSFHSRESGWGAARCPRLALTVRSAQPLPTLTPTPTRTPTPTNTPTPTRTPTATPAVDLVIDAIEITQAIQDLNNTVPLVANKRTYARGHVRARGTSSVAHVLGRFTIVRDATSHGPYVADNPGGRITVRSAPDRGNVNDSFFLEIPMTHLGAGALRVCLEVNPDRRISETNYANNQQCTDVTLTASPSVRVKVYDVRYRQGGTTHQAGPFHIGMLISWLRRAYPTANVEWRMATLDWTDPNPPSAYGDDGCDKVNELLARQRALDGSPPRWRYYGLVGDTGGFMRGCSAGIPAYIASGPTGLPRNNFAWDTDGSYGDWYGGHELGHTYGRVHAEFCGAGGGGPYPYPEGRIGGPAGAPQRYFGWDIEQRQVYPWDWTDVMTYCANEWISDFTYTGIRERLIAEGAGAMQAAAFPEATEYLAVFGRANLTQGTATLGTLYRLTDIPAGEAPTPSNDWSLALLDAGGGTLASYPFTPKVDSETDPGEDVMASIIETVPWKPGTARIVVRYQGQAIAERLVSANAPTVQVLAPNGGEVLGSSALVRWTASDPDGDPLTYALLYSADNGATWQTVATQLTETQQTVDLTELPGSDQARFRVMASDGVNTGSDESDAGFKVPRKAPQALIIAPDQGANFLPEQQVVLAGEGYDVEDGNLAAAALRWSSDRQGDLGSGRHLSVTGLQDGRHVITLRVTDSHGQSSTASRVIFIGGEAVYLPLLLR